MTSIDGATPRRFRASLIGCSTLALVAPTAAWTACSPNPTQAGATTTCDGSEAAGLSVGTTGTVVLVNPAAAITAPAGVAAIRVSAAPPTATYVTLAATINDNGRVDGGSASGILVTPVPPGPSYYYIYYSETAVNVGSGGVLTGVNGISISRNPTSPNTVGRVTLDNSGTISGTSGVALLVSEPNVGSFGIVNRATGMIQSINAPVATLDNAGTIDGGALSALATPSDSYYYYSGYTTVTNSGTIRSAASAATIALHGDYSYPGVTNSGTIANSGSGAAIASDGSLALTNAAGGRVTTAGAVAVSAATILNVTNDGTISAAGAAISAGGGLRVTNRGSIVGDVRSGTTGNSSIDTSGGTITGNVILGAGDDTVTAAYGAGTTFTGISGTLDAGGGTNTLRLAFAGDTTLNAPVALPATFQTLTYALGGGVTLTLAPGFTQSTTVLLGTVGGFGTGSVVNNATFATTGPAIAQPYFEYGTVGVTNTGSLTATLSRPYDAVVALGYNSSLVTNSGSITAIGGKGLTLGGGTLTNSGSITADGDAVTGFNTVLVNSGSIVSTGGTGFVGSGSQTIETNSGTISGTTAGAQVDNITLINTGTITSPQTGVALGNDAVLDNRAGGVINGGVGPSSPYGFAYTYQVKVINAGTINGNVDFGSSPYAAFSQTNNIFVASPGGVVNGNLFLGGGNDVFVTSLTNTGSGAFAGVTGTVGGTGTETIRYVVDTSTSAVVAPAGTFSRLGYELTKGTTLTLTAAAPEILGVEFGGSGTVDLTADLAQTNATVINLTAQSALLPAYPPVPNAVTLTSHGTLSATSTVSAAYYAPPAVLLDAGSSFTNDGTIVLQSTGARLIGIAGAGTATNAGTITLDGATAIGASGYVGYPLTVVNSGTISQTGGGATSTGISGATAITNSGSIIVGGAAVSVGGFSPLVVTNSGTLRSTGGAAITGGTYYYSSATVTNAAGANIIGVGQAVVLPGGGVVDNSGSISGDVVLGCTSGFCYGGGASTYVARAGSSLIGNLTFGASDDTFISFDGATGVTGTISGGGGVNTYARAYATSTTVAAGVGLPTGFQRQGIGAAGAGTVVTVTGPAAGLDQGLFFFGDGQVVNQATVNGGNQQSGVHTVSLGGPAGLPGVGSTPAFTNQATLNDGVAGSVHSFTNSGTIDAPAGGGEAVNLTIPAGQFDFTNSGTIATATYCYGYGYGYGAPTCYADPSVAIATAYGTTTGVATVTNSGTLTGAFDVAVTATNLTLDNSGTITDAPGSIYATPNYVAVGIGTGVNADTVTVTNRGTIANGLVLYGPMRSLAVTNSGTIGNTSGGALYLVQDPRRLIDATGGVTFADQDSATLTNSGTVDGTIEVAAHATTTSVLNSGTVTKPAITPIRGFGTITVGAQTVGSQTITVVNSGSVIDATVAGAALAVTGFASSPTGPGPAATPMAGGPAASIAITNSGTLRADGGGQVVLGTSDYPGDTLSPAIALKAVATSDGASQLTITNAAGGIISATGAPGLASGPGPVTGGFGTGGSIAVFASATTVAITNAGTISGGTGTTIAAGSTVSLPTTLADPEAYLAGAVATVGSVDTLVNAKTGVITGSIDLGAFDDRIENYGTITGNVYLRDGNDTFVQSLGATLTGVADGGAGTNTLLLDATGGGAVTQALLNRFVNFAAPTISGTGTITTTGPLSLSTLTVTGGTLTLAAASTLATSGPVTITAGDADVVIVNLGTIAGGIALGGGSDRIDNRGIIGGDLVLGGGADAITNSGTISGAVTTGNGAVSLANRGTIAGSLALGDGPVQLTNGGMVAAVVLGGGTSTVSNTGMITGGVTGSGPVSLANGGSIAGGVVFGDGVAQLTNGGRIDLIVFGNGNDTVINTGTVSGAVSFGNGADTLTNGGTLAGPVRFGAGATVVNSGSITGTLIFGSGPATVTTSGPITGPVTFGSGNDALILQHGGRVGAVDGGAGSNTLVIAMGGSDATPDEVVLSGVTGFGRTRVAGGVTALSGPYATGTLEVAVGRLIGRTGSTITAPTITVAPGATFGSAGTVVGNVAVSGTLSPGASPGTMTVTGNVVLAAGSTSLFEFTPAVSDRLLVSGVLTIGSGASLTLTGTRPLMPGMALDLIIAGGGISGSFTTIDQASTVVGFLRQSATRLQLFGEFALDPAFAPGAKASINFVNSLLIGGTASPALLAAVPSMLTADGGTNGAAFALLTPEAYASASRIGTENGMSIAGALRAAADEARIGGVFTFVQGVGAWRQLRGDANAGRAEVSSGGIVGGIGFGLGSVALSAFGGYLDSRQSIGSLGAHTVAAGSVAGVSGTLNTGALGAVVTLAYDGSDATTTRTVPAVTTSGAYSLHGFVVDGRLTYALPLGPVRLSPEVGVTHVATMRGSATETGSAAFGLTVAARTDRADFVDGALRIAAARPAAFAPWASLGVRYEIDGRDRLAAAHFGGGTSDLIAPGVAVADAVASVGAGINWLLGARLMLYSVYRGEFARGETGHSATLGHGSPFEMERMRIGLPLRRSLCDILFERGSNGRLACTIILKRPAG